MFPKVSEEDDVAAGFYESETEAKKREEVF